MVKPTLQMENQGLNRLSDFPEALQLVGYRNSAQSRPPDSQEATNPSWSNR